MNEIIVVGVSRGLGVLRGVAHTLQVSSAIPGLEIGFQTGYTETGNHLEPKGNQLKPKGN